MKADVPERRNESRKAAKRRCPVFTSLSMVPAGMGTIAGLFTTLRVLKHAKPKVRIRAKLIANSTRRGHATKETSALTATRRKQQSQTSLRTT